MEEIRIGVYICWCGTNIAKNVDVERVAAEAGKLQGVVVARDYKYMCSDPGQDLMVKDIQEMNLNRIVVAACSPRIHEMTFRKALEKAGLNPYLFQMANIREQVSWVHDDREKATLKAIDLVTGAVKRVRWQEALNKRSVKVNPATLVIGGGIAGLTAAREIARTGRIVFLVEKEKSLGGMMKKINRTFPNLDEASKYLNPIIEEVSSHPHIQVYLNSQLVKLSGYVGNFIGTVNHRETQSELEFGNIIVATGLKPFKPVPLSNYAYQRLPNIITSVEFEEMLRHGYIRLDSRQEPKHVAIIHCVGSRNPDFLPYCSRTCCQTALKFANQIKDLLPKAHVYQIYADMRSMSKGCEEMYSKTAKRGVMFLMYDQKGKLPYIHEAGKNEKTRLVIEMKELLSGEQVEVPADLVILMVGMEAQETSKQLSQVLGISRCSNNFYIEKHPKLDPVATTTDGVFIVGSCQAPKEISDSASQAKAAAARVLAMIYKGSIEVEVITSSVREEICCGCQTCVHVCPYGAIEYLKEKKVCSVNEVICKGCGTCASACPTGAIGSRHFTEKQILAQIEGVMLQLLDV
ncbi:MAG: CoB--CoM heterodisulfide reductase iron-sulfur subunit A family protein [Bacteroidales bacterium]